MKKTKSKLKFNAVLKILLKQDIEDNRSMGGNSWKEYTKEEIEAIYGYLPYWARDLT